MRLIRRSAIGAGTLLFLGTVAKEDFGCFPISEIVRVFWYSDNGFDEVSSQTDWLEAQNKYPAAYHAREVDREASTAFRNFLRNFEASGHEYRFTMNRYLKEGDCFQPLSWMETVGTESTLKSFYEGPILPAKKATLPPLLMFDLWIPQRLLDSKLLPGPHNEQRGARFMIASTHRPADEFFGNAPYSPEHTVTASNRPAPGSAMCHAKPPVSTLQRMLYNEDTKLYILVHKQELVDDYLRYVNTRQMDLITIIGPGDLTRDNSPVKVGSGLFTNLKNKMTCLPLFPQEPEIKPDEPEVVDPSNAPDLSEEADHTTLPTGRKRGGIPIASAAGGLIGAAALGTTGYMYYRRPRMAMPEIEEAPEPDFADDDLYRDTAVTVNESEYGS